MSTYLATKSTENFQLAKRILDEKKGCYASSVHCAYYACVQLMLHILRTDLAKSEAEIEAESMEGSKNEGGFHNWIIKGISQAFFLRDKKYVESRDFADKINELKGLRVKADYKNVEINEKKAKKAVEYAESVTFALQKYFKV